MRNMIAPAGISGLVKNIIVPLMVVSVKHFEHFVGCNIFSNTVGHFICSFPTFLVGTRGIGSIQW